MSPVYLFAFSTSTRSEKEPNGETIGMKIYYIFIPIVSHKDSFCHGGKSKLGIGLFIHELLREPLILLGDTTAGTYSTEKPQLKCQAQGELNLAPKYFACPSVWLLCT